jgi:hypothetical protein
VSDGHSKTAAVVEAERFVQEAHVAWSVFGPGVKLAKEI